MSSYSWYTIETDDEWGYLYFCNKAGVKRLENKRRLPYIDELYTIKDQQEAFKRHMDDIVGNAIKQAMELAKNDPEEFHRRMNKNRP